MNNRKWLYGGFIAIVLSILTFVVWSMFLAPQREQEATISFPDELVGLPQTQYVSGPQAIQQISRMHGTNITIDEGHIVNYGQGEKEIILWVSVSPTDEEGIELYRLMDKKMPQSKVFTDRREVKEGGLDMIHVKGMGMDHYYWVIGKYNYWVGIKGLDTAEVLDEITEEV